MNEPRKVSLDGDIVSLDILERIFNDEIINIFSETNVGIKKFYLESTLFENIDAKEVRKVSNKLIEEINSICCFVKKYYTPIKIGEVYIGNCIYVVLEEHLLIRDDLYIIENGVKKDFDEETIFDIYSKNKKDSLLNEILALFYKKGKDWVNLYRILDLFEEKEIDIVEQEWITKKDMRLLKHTANSPAAIGNEARHGKQSGIAPPNPMPLTMAQILVEKIVWNYIRSLDE